MGTAISTKPAGQKNMYGSPSAKDSSIEKARYPWQPSLWLKCGNRRQTFCSALNSRVIRFSVSYTVTGIPVQLLKASSAS